MQWVPRDEVLTFEEIERLARLFVERFGFTSIRLTGGEPTVRAHLLDAGRSAGRARRRPVDDDQRVVAAARRARACATPASQRVNISLDSLRRDRFLELTRRDELASVLDGIDAALEAGFDPVKVNVVCMDGVNDDEVVDFATFGRERGVEVRFIEWMPLDAGHTWERVRVVPGERIIATIDAVYPLVPLPRGDEPAEVWAYADGGGRVGAIPSVTAPFCAVVRPGAAHRRGEAARRACSRSRRPTCGRSCAAAAPTTTWSPRSRRASPRKWAGHQIGQVTLRAAAADR